MTFPDLKDVVVLVTALLAFKVSFGTYALPTVLLLSLGFVQNLLCFSEARVRIPAGAMKYFYPFNHSAVLGFN